MSMRKVEVMLDPGMHDQIKERAKARQVSANEWMRLALGSALSGQHAVEVTTSTTIRRAL